jgi:hypothetical protein
VIICVLIVIHHAWLALDQEITDVHYVIRNLLPMEYYQEINAFKLVNQDSMKVCKIVMIKIDVKKYIMDHIHKCSMYLQYLKIF